MADMEKLVGQWVEVEERGAPDRLVLMRPDADVPLKRGGRRNLDMAPDGAATSLAQGAHDGLEPVAKGQWLEEGEGLKLELEGWEGSYDLDMMTDTELILRRR